MHSKRSKVIFVRPKKFYRPKELEGILPMSQKALLQNAFLCGALYRVRGRKLINLETIRIFLEKVGNLSEEIGGKYCQVKDATIYLGVNEEQAMQIASDAGALFKVRNMLLIDKEQLVGFMDKFKFEVHYFDIEEVEEQARIERRLKNYVL